MSTTSAAEALAPATSSRRTRDFVLLLVANMMFGAQFPATKVAVSGLGATLLSALTFLLASICLIPFLVAESKAHPDQPRLRELLRPGMLGPFLFVTVLGLLPASIVLSWGVDRSLASNGALLTLSIPVLTAMLASLVRGEQMTKWRWLSFVLGIAGAAITSEVNWRELDFFSGRFLFGNSLILIGCLGNGFNTVYSKELLERFRPVRLLVITYLFTAALCVPILLLQPANLRTVTQLPWQTWFGLLILGVFPWGLGMIIWFRVLSRLEATQVGLSIYLLPFFGILLSAVFLGERLTPEILGGGALVLVGTSIVLFADRPRH